jgi:hypothetical protein
MNRSARFSWERMRCAWFALLCNATTLRTISGNESGLSPVIFQKRNTCVVNSLKKNLYPSKAQALEQTDDYVHPKVYQEVGSELKAK